MLYYNKHNGNKVNKRLEDNYEKNSKNYKDNRS